MGLSFAINAPEEMARNEAELLQLLSSHRALPHIGASFALEEAAAALQFVAEGNAIGKVVLDVLDVLDVHDGSGRGPQ